MAIPWLVLIAGFIIFVQVLIYKRWGLTNIEYNRTFSQKAVFEGEEVEMVEVISNNKVLPVPWLRLESRISANLQFKKEFELDIQNQQFHSSLFSLKPYQKITRRHKVTCAKRGYYWLDSVSITGGDPIIFDEKHEKVSLSANLLVYPKLIPIKEIPLPSHSWLGDILVKRWIIEDPFIIAGVREYASGDSLNSINWNATARTGALQVSKKDFTADHNLLIYLNFDTTEDIWMPISDEELIETGISYAASIAQYSISNGIPTGFGCNSYLSNPLNEVIKNKQSVRVDPSSGKHHLTHLLETMAMLEMGRSMNFHHFLKEDVDRQLRDTDILLITAINSERIQQQIRQLESQGNSVQIVWLGEDIGKKQDTEVVGDDKQYVS